MGPNRIGRSRLLLLGAPALLIAAARAFSQPPDYADRRAADVKRCEAIDRSAYETGLYFNPAGYRSYYVRSHCFQDAAIRYREESLCSQVRRRFSLFASSWGISSSSCEARVEEAIAADRKQLEEIRGRYREGGVTLRDFQLELNGNGRDFDVLLTFAGTRGAGYHLTLDLAPNAGAPAIVIHSSGYYVDGETELHIFLRREDIQRAVPGFTAGRPYTMRASLTLSLPTGSGDAAWSNAFVESVFPARDRTQSLARTITFPPARPPLQQRGDAATSETAGGYFPPPFFLRKSRKYFR